VGRRPSGGAPKSDEQHAIEIARKKRRTSNPDKRHRDFADSASENLTLNFGRKNKPAGTLGAKLMLKSKAEIIED
jgi:hypothetical protein